MQSQSLTEDEKHFCVSQLIMIENGLFPPPVFKKVTHINKNLTASDEIIVHLSRITMTVGGLLVYVARQLSIKSVKTTPHSPTEAD